jgi:hypothetical protein
MISVIVNAFLNYGTLFSTHFKVRKLLQSHVANNCHRDRMDGGSRCFDRTGFSPEFFYKKLFFHPTFT